MAKPDFSELTFSFAFLNELQWFLWNNTPNPHLWLFFNFLTVHEEVNIGADVVFNNGLTPIYIQFKRSGVIKAQKGRTPKELKPNPARTNNFTLNDRPFYRMHLHKNKEYLQHHTLQAQEVIALKRVFKCYQPSAKPRCLADCIVQSDGFFSSISVLLSLFQYL